MNKIKTWLQQHTLFMNDANFLAQVAHFFGAYSIVFTMGVFLGWPGALGFAGGITAYAAIKEFYFDANFELPHQTFADNMLDFSMLVAGAAVALLVKLGV